MGKLKNHTIDNSQNQCYYYNNFNFGVIFIKKLFILLFLPFALLSCACGLNENLSDSSKQTGSTESKPIESKTENTTSINPTETVTRKNIKINFLGDSITAGVGASAKSKCYVNQIGLKVDTVRNYGIGSTSIAYQIKSSVPGRYFCNRYQEMDNDADYIVIFGGTNDYGFGDAPLGKPDDATPETFYGSLNYLYSAIMNNYPDSKIIVVTPMHMLGDDNLQGYNGYKGKDVATLETYVNIIKQVAGTYSLPVIDLYSVSELNPNNPELKNTYFADGVHPNDSGHKLISEIILNFINSVE